MGNISRDGLFSLRSLVAHLGDGFALFDSEDRLLVWNEAYESLNTKIRDLLVEGVTFDTLIQALVERGQIPEAIGHEQEWIEDRIRAHCSPGEDVERQVSDGRWFIIRERPTADGGVVGIWSDITERKHAEQALRESEERFRQFAMLSSDWFWEMGPDFRFSYFSHGYERKTGLSASDLIGKKREELSEDIGEEEKWAGHRADLAAHRPFRKFIYSVRTDSGETAYRSVSGTPIFDQNGDFRGYRGTATDVTEGKRAEAAIHQLSKQNELILGSAGEGIYGLDAEGRTTFCNPAAARMIGWAPEELIGKMQHQILHHSRSDGSPYPREECPIYMAFRDGDVHHITDEVFWRKDGTSFPVEYVSTPIREGHRLVGAVVVFRDITERKEAEDRIRHLADHDALTDLPSLRLAMDRLANALARARRNKVGTAVMFVDLDDFKAVNDTLGHKAGDHVLKEAAARLSGLVREADTVGRVGGDEFVVVLADVTDPEASSRVAEKMVDALRQPFQYGNEFIETGVSIGIARFPDHGTTPDDLIRRADEAMYTVKRGGKNGYKVVG